MLHALLHACSCASAATCVRDLSSPLVAVGGFWPSVFLCYKSSRPPSVKSLQQSQSSCTLSFSRSVSCAHTRWKSRPPKRLRPLGSPARVRTAITFLGSVSGGTTTRFCSLFPAATSTSSCSGDGAARLLPGARRTSGIFTATFLHCTKRDDYIDKAPCRFRVLPALPLGMPI